MGTPPDPLNKKPTHIMKSRTRAYTKEWGFTIVVIYLVQLFEANMSTGTTITLGVFSPSPFFSILLCSFRFYYTNKQNHFLSMNNPYCNVSYSPLNTIYLI